MEKHDRQVTITAKYIPLLAEFMGHQDIRYYLNAILVEPNQNGGITLIATDGHAMAIIQDLNGSTNGTWICAMPQKIISACSLKERKNKIFSGAKVLKLIGEVGHVLGAVDADAASIGRYHLETAYCEVIEAKPVGWRKVIPTKFKPCKQVGINASLLSKIQKACRDRGSDISPIEIFLNDKNNAVVVRPAAVPEMVVIIMPMRSDMKEPAIPNWLLQEINKPEEELKKAA